MAQFKIHGLTELQRQIAEISELDKGEIAKKMLKEGSKDVEKVWYDESVARHKLTGAMADAIKTSRVRKNAYGRYTVTHPMDYEERTRHGETVKVRHAEKAFYQHYGWTNNQTGNFIPGDRFVDIIDRRAEPLAEKTMQTIWDKYLKDKQS